jgi:hypothetical protein
MIRRWSCINSLNTNKSLSFKNIQIFFKQQNVSETRWLTWKVSQTTVFVRKRVSRRQHLNKWVIYTFLLENWKNQYRFTRIKNNYIFPKNFFQYTYPTFKYVFSRFYKPFQLKLTEFFFTYCKISKNIKKDTNFLTTYLKLYDYSQSWSMSLHKVGTSITKIELHPLQFHFYFPSLMSYYRTLILVTNYKNL